MAESKRKHPQHTVATPDDLWNEFGRSVESIGTDRSKMLNLFMAWWVRREGVTLPRRPQRRD